MDHVMDDPHRHRCTGYQQVEERIEAALMARAMDADRTAMQAEFLEAQRLARQCGTLRQMMRARYLHACTDHGWFGVAAAPRNAFVQLCAEYLYRSSVWELDYLVHLWVLAQASAARYGSLQPQTFRQAELAVNDALTWLAGSASRPVQAAWAQWLLAVMGWARAYLSGGELRPWWLQMRSIVQEAQSLPTFPLDRVTQWLSRLQETAPREAALSEWTAQLARLREKRLGTMPLAAPRTLAAQRQHHRKEAQRRHEQRR